MSYCPSCENTVETASKFCPFCGAHITVVQSAGDDPYLGKLVSGKYQVERLIGEGGMGRVYKAVQQPLEKSVVLKVLRSDLQGDASLVARFQREARAASRLSHPNSIQVTDFGQMEDGSLYIAMEYLEGRDLAEEMSASGPFSEERLIHVVNQILSALADAHASGVIHRDLKPENVMVVPRRDDPDFVKVLDFGIAKLQDGRGGQDAVALTQAGLVCGTPEYMSPEQARGDELDARSDIYAIGVLMYQLATGSLPFQAESAIALVTKHLTEEPVSPATVVPGMNPALEALILKCMAKNRDHRPESAEALREELRKIQGDRIVALNSLSAPPSLPPTSYENGPRPPGEMPPHVEEFVPSSPASPDDSFEEQEIRAGKKTSMLPVFALLGLLFVVPAIGGVGYLLLSGSASRVKVQEDRETGSATVGAPDDVDSLSATESETHRDSDLELSVEPLVAAREEGLDASKRDEATKSNAGNERNNEAEVPRRVEQESPARAADGSKDSVGTKRSAIAQTKSEPVRRTKVERSSSPSKEVSPGAKTRNVPPRATRHDPERARSLASRAEKHWADGDFEVALGLYEQAARHDPNEPSYQRQIGLGYLTLGRREEAVPVLQRYLQLAPNAPDRAVIERAIRQHSSR